MSATSTDTGDSRRVWLLSVRVVVLAALLALAYVGIAGRVPSDAVFDRGFAHRARLDALFGPTASDPPDILIIGDSVQRHCGPTEDPCGYIPDRLAAQLPTHRVALLEQDGGSTPIYREMVRYLTRLPNKPRAVVMEINLASFNPRHGQPYVAERSVLAVAGTPFESFLKPLVVFWFNGAWGTTPREIARESAAYEREVAAEIGLEPPISPFFLDFMGRLGPDHPHVTALRDAARDLVNAGIAPLIYLTPISPNPGTGAAQAAFTARVDRSVTVLREALAEVGVNLLDLSHNQLSANGLWDTVHLRPSGKALVTRELSAWIRNVLDRPPGGANGVAGEAPGG